MNLMNRDDEVARAEHARQLLKDELLNEALAEIEAATIQKWEAAKSTQEREDYWRLYRINKLFRTALETHVQTGKMAELQLAEKRRFGLF